MRVTLGDVVCEYEMHKTDSADTVLFLHGWGGDLRSFAGAYSAVCDWGVSCVRLAFPKTVPSDWGIYDYATLVEKFIESLGITDPVIVGHSFGGRIALILAAQGKCKKLALTAAAGMKPKFSLKRAVRIAAYRRKKKRGKPLDGAGSLDYNNLEPEMRGVFVRIVNAHLDGLLPYIKCKTLLYWGRRDRDTPLYMAKRLKRGIADSELIVTDGGHFAYAESGYGFASALKSFIME